MSKNSKIEWCDHTFNPWIGCTKISPGCDNCYAEAMMDTRMHKVQWGAAAPRARTTPENWRQPVRWNARHDEFMAAHGRRQRVFCSSLADVFDNGVPSTWRHDLFALIVATPNLDWLLLTKRIGIVRERLLGTHLSPMPNNVWIGATIVNQAEADRDIPKLLAVPARVRFLSIEPMLGPIDLLWPETLWPDGPTRCCSGHECGCGGQPIDPWLLHGVNWVIAGGESGPSARPAHPDWFRSLRDQCKTAGVPFLFKQWGEWSAPGISFPDGRPDLAETDELARFKVGKRAAGRLLDGRTHDEFPGAER